MKKLQVLRIANHIILAFSIIGYYSIWQDSESLQSIGIINEYVKSYIIVSLVISIFFWFFILTFCDNAEDSKEILSLLKGENIQKTDKQKDRENKEIAKENEIIDIEGMKQSVSSNELIVKVKGSGKIEKITKEDWEEIVKMGNAEKFEIKYKNN
tara:strand:+ start:955 stop:1419 length:465 start_codon:yes stop_codon:yes gene_type:complete